MAKATKESQPINYNDKVMMRNRRLLFIFSLVVCVLLIGLWFAFEVTVGFAFLILGIGLLSFSAEKAVKHSVSIASALRSHLSL